jgi:RNase P/RNase MRP subunit p29
MKNIEQLMAEADPVQTLRQTGNVRILKPLTSESNEVAKETTAKPAEIKPEPVAAPVSVTPKPVSAVIPSTPPPFEPVAIPSTVEIKKVNPTSTPIPIVRVPGGTPAPEEDDSPFILKPAATASVPKVVVPVATSSIPFASIFRRKARMTDVARIVLPPKREESEPAPVSTDPSPTVVPPAFPVAAMTARAGSPAVTNLDADKAFESITSEKIVNEVKTAESVVSPVSKDAPSPDAEKTKPAPDLFPEIKGTIEAKTETPFTDKIPEASVPAEKSTELKTESSSVPKPDADTQPVTPVVATSADAPKVDPEAHKPEPSATPLPKIDPEAHKVAPKAAEPTPVATLSTASAPPEKREFHLANGERVAGTVLSESPEAVYIEHSTLGVLTIPRANIAKRLVEIILINGDRIVGDIMAETADTLYVRHASLGMLTVPRAQRSTRVVEAILKDGDRILGEVLTETDTFTVIRSATLGTITVPHSKMAMLNRKIEQIEMKALSPPAPELKDKPSA